MKKMGRLKKWLGSALVVTVCVMSAAQLSLASTQETSYPVAKTENGYIIIDDNGKKMTAFCWNKNLKQPDFDGDGVYYKPGVAYTEHGGVTLSQIRALFYAGYPFDAYGLADKYFGGLPAASRDVVAYKATQDAFWFLLGQMNLTEGAESGIYRRIASLCGTF